MLKNGWDDKFYGMYFDTIKNQIKKIITWEEELESYTTNNKNSDKSLSTNTSQ